MFFLYKDNGYLYREGCCSAPSFCTINLVMLSAEEKMREYLRSKTLSWLNEELDRVLPKQYEKIPRNILRKVAYKTNLS